MRVRDHSPHRSGAGVIATIMLVACSACSSPVPQSSPSQRGKATPTQTSAASSPRTSHTVPQRLFDAAIQQLACRERQQEQAAQIARGVVATAMQPGRDGCTAGTPLQIEAMLRTAAAQGDTDAKRYLLAQRAAQVMQRAVAEAPAGTQARLSSADEREVDALVKDLELLALSGDRDAIETLAQVVESPLLHAPDPVYAAAWRLASRQPPTRTPDLAAPLEAEDEIVESLPPQQQQQARSLAVELFGYCCRAHGGAG